MHVSDEEVIDLSGFIGEQGDLEIQKMEDVTCVFETVWGFKKLDQSRLGGVTHGRKGKKKQGKFSFLLLNQLYTLQSSPRVACMSSASSNATTFFP